MADYIFDILPWMLVDNGETTGDRRTMMRKVTDAHYTDYLAANFFFGKEGKSFAPVLLDERKKYSIYKGFALP